MAKIAPLDHLADAVGDEGDIAADDVGGGAGDRLQRELGVGAVLRAPEMREQHDLGALVGQFEDGRRDALDAGGVGHLAVGHRHVEIDPDEHALALDVAEVIEGAEMGHDRLLQTNAAGHYREAAWMQDKGAEAQLPRLL